MPKVMVIDDESMIRKGIVSIIRRLAPHWEISESKDAAGAMLRLSKEEPDLMLIDINMPGMDGLALAHLLKDEHPGVLKIILTGHDKFTYAQNALRAEVLDYLLKPIIREELLEALTKAERLIAERREAAQREKDERRRRLQRTLEELLCGSAESEASLRQVLAECGWRFGAKEFSLLLLIGSREGFAVPEEELSRVNEAFRAHFEEVEDAFAFFADARHLFVLSSGTALPGEKMGQWWRNVGSFRVEEAGGAPDVIVGTSPSFASLAELPGVYGNVIHELYNAENGVKKLFSIYWDKDWSELRNKVEITLETNDDESFRHMLEEELQAIRTNARERPSIMLPRIFHFLLFALLPVLSRTESRLSLMLRQSLPYVLARLSSPGAAIHLPSILYEFEGAFSRSAADRGGHSEKNQIIEAVKDHIGKNYGDQSLKLESLAKVVHLNANYLSDLFKEVTGENYLAYLTSIRMEHAKRLLRETHLKAYEVADRTGYSSAKYFCRLFRQLFGMTPSEYRNRAEFRPRVPAADQPTHVR